MIYLCFIAQVLKICKIPYQLVLGVFEKLEKGEKIHNLTLNLQ